MYHLVKKGEAMAVGRPRCFDVDEALDRALTVFWRRGYEGASLDDLTAAMGINRPSLYAAFGNKEALFRKAMERYLAGPASFVKASLELPTARAVAERLLYGSVELLNDPRHPGCLMVQAALVCGEGAEAVRRELIARRAEGDALIRERFERAATEGDLPADTNPADLANYVVTVMRGLAVQAASGVNGEELRRVAETALRAWPGHFTPSADRGSAR
jgi:AcrR family transcriptional regulator